MKTKLHTGVTGVYFISVIVEVVLRLVGNRSNIFILLLDGAMRLSTVLKSFVITIKDRRITYYHQDTNLFSHTFLLCITLRMGITILNFRNVLKINYPTKNILTGKSR